jgi:hypothetical protein
LITGIFLGVVPEAESVQAEQWVIEGLNLKTAVETTNSRNTRNDRL